MARVEQLYKLGRKLPSPVADVARLLERAVVPKRWAELHYWRGLFDAQGGVIQANFYERLLLALAGETSQAFLGDKVVVDFGCGPQGSLAWATEAKIRIGVDLLAADYWALFPLADQGMVYLTSTETVIPLPDGCADVLFTLNALDHVSDFEAMCAELLRVLAPGGLFFGSFNLGHEPTATEPQSLTEERIRLAMLDRLGVESYCTAAVPADPSQLYEQLITGDPAPYHGGEGILWVRARKPLVGYGELDRDPR